MRSERRSLAGQKIHVKIKNETEDFVSRVIAAWERKSDIIAENRQKIQIEKIFINMEHLDDAFASWIRIIYFFLFQYVICGYFVLFYNYSVKSTSNNKHT